MQSLREMVDGIPPVTRVTVRDISTTYFLEYYHLAEHGVKSDDRGVLEAMQPWIIGERRPEPTVYSLLNVDVPAHVHRLSVTIAVDHARRAFKIEAATQVIGAGDRRWANFDYIPFDSVIQDYSVMTHVVSRVVTDMFRGRATPWAGYDNDGVLPCCHESTGNMWLVLMVSAMRELSGMIQEVHRGAPRLFAQWFGVAEEVQRYIDLFREMMAMQRSPWIVSPILPRGDDRLFMWFMPHIGENPDAYADLHDENELRYSTYIRNINYNQEWVPNATTLLNLLSAPALGFERGTAVNGTMGYRDFIRSRPPRTEKKYGDGEGRENQAEILFGLMFPAFYKAKRVVIPSKKMEGIEYRINLEYSPDYLMVVDVSNGANNELCRLCIEIKNVEEGYYTAPEYDRVLQRIWFLQKDEQEVWDKSYVHESHDWSKKIERRVIDRTKEVLNKFNATLWYDAFDRSIVAVGLRRYRG